MSDKAPDIPGQVKIKICGVRTAAAAAAAVEAGADFVGLVFVPQSPRHVDAGQAREVLRAVAGRAEAVGVFRDETAEQIAGMLSAAPGLSRVQLHGPSRRAAEARLEAAVICAVTFDRSIEEEIATWMRTLSRLPRPAALFIDAPDATGLGGGTGRTFDWAALREVLDRVRPSMPVVLAGGLTPENVGRAVETVRPWAVDVSSGVESARGVKDAAKIRAFCEAVRALGR